MRFGTTCAILIAIFLATSSCRTDSVTIDATCDLKVAHMPTEMRQYYLDINGRLRRELTPEEREFAIRIAGNNRIIAERCNLADQGQ